jgi:GR25 family glycosyltransferase involved in LPS biosynthesis
VMDLFVGVISPDGKPRNSNLLYELSELSTEITVNGYFASVEASGGDATLTAAELACKRSHAFMYDKAKDKYEWALILEDDADIDKAKLKQLWDEIQKTGVTTAHIISCYLGKWSVLRKSTVFAGGLESIYPPDGAVCYFINAEAMLIASNDFDLLRPADWPLWSRTIKFVVFPAIAWELKSAVSFVDPEKSRNKVSRSPLTKLREFLGLDYFKHLGVNGESLHSIWYWVYRQRLAWYFPRLFKGERSSKFLENFRD